MSSLAEPFSQQESSGSCGSDAPKEDEHIQKLVRETTIPSSSSSPSEEEDSFSNNTSSNNLTLETCVGHHHHRGGELDGSSSSLSMDNSSNCSSSTTPRINCNHLTHNDVSTSIVIEDEDVVISTQSRRISNAPLPNNNQHQATSSLDSANSSTGNPSSFFCFSSSSPTSTPATPGGLGEQYHPNMIIPGNLPLSSVVLHSSRLDVASPCASPYNKLESSSTTTNGKVSGVRLFRDDDHHGEQLQDNANKQQSLAKQETTNQLPLQEHQEPSIEEPPSLTATKTITAENTTIAHQMDKISDEQTQQESLTDRGSTKTALTEPSKTAVPSKPFRFMQKKPSFINPNLMNLLFSSLLSLQDLKPSENQVAGHGQKDGEEHLVVRHLRDKIYKPINTHSKRAFDEVKFYEIQAPKISFLAPFLPNYYGVQRVQENEQQFLVLEDLTASFRNPSLLDIRMGQRVYGDDASAEKIKMFDEKYIHQKELGFSFSGMKVYNTDKEFSLKNKNPNIVQKDGMYKVYDRYWGRNCNPGEETVVALENFFFDTSYENREQVGLNNLRSMLHQLRQLSDFLCLQLIFRMYSSSLLLVFDAEKAIVKMIDFAHVHENKEPQIDDNYMYGLKKLIHYFEEVLRRHTIKPVDNLEIREIPDSEGYQSSDSDD